VCVFSATSPSWRFEITDELITLNRLLHNDFNWRQSVCYESLCLSVLGQIFYVWMFVASRFLLAKQIFNRSLGFLCFAVFPWCDYRVETEDFNASAFLILLYTGCSLHEGCCLWLFYKRLFREPSSTRSVDHVNVRCAVPLLNFSAVTVIGICCDFNGILALFSRSFLGGHPLFCRASLATD